MTQQLTRWGELCQALATDADALAAPEPGADATEYHDRWYELACRWVALVWSGIKPELIAASCRYALQQLTPPVLEFQPKQDPPPGFELIESQKLNALLLLAAQQEEKARGKQQRAGTGKPGPRPFFETEPDHEATAATRRADYAAKKAAERAVEEQAEAERRAKVLAIAAAAPAVEPEPAEKVEPEPEALPVENAEPEPAADTDDGPIWVSAEELARVLGITVSFVAQMRRAEVFGMDIRQKRGKGYWFDLEAAKQAFAERPLQRKSRARPPADLPPPMPVTIEPLAEVEVIEPQAPAPAPDPEVPMPGADDAQALLELAGGDPAVLEALRVLLQQPQGKP